MSELNRKRPAGVRGAEGSRRRRAQSGSEKLPRKKCELADCDARLKATAQRKEYTPRNEKLMVVEAARQKARNETEPKGQMLIPTDEVETQGP